MVVFNLSLLRKEKKYKCVKTLLLGEHFSRSFITDPGPRVKILDLRNITTSSRYKMASANKAIFKVFIFKATKTQPQRNIKRVGLKLMINMLSR
jgi:hypothetical protein